MGLLDWLFGKRQAAPQAYGSRRYGYPTGNLELTIRHEQGGEDLMTVHSQVLVQWRPGNEHLWDEFDPESLIDTEERRRYTVNQLIYSRIRLYRALRAAGHDVRGRDPFEFTELVPAEYARLLALFPAALGPVPGAPDVEPGAAPDRGGM